MRLILNNDWIVPLVGLSAGSKNRTAIAWPSSGRLTSFNGQAYTWDANGNLFGYAQGKLANDRTKTYAYDQANRLRLVNSGQSTVLPTTACAIGCNRQLASQQRARRQILRLVSRRS